MTSATAQQPSIDAIARAELGLDRWRVRPSFEPALERGYEAYSSERRFRAIRFWLLFGLLLRVLGLANDISIGGDTLTYGLVLRLGILIPVVLVSLWFLSPRHSVLAQGIAATAAPYLCVVGLCLLGAVAPDPNAFRYFLLAGVNIVAINLVMPLRFHHAVAYTGLSVATFLFMAMSGLGNIDPHAVIDIVFLYSVAAIASLMVAYRNEIADRRAFLASEKINLQALALAHANRELQRLLNTDALTGVHNRRFLDQFIKARGETAAAERASLGVLMVDVDHFKAYNDLSGHRAGDECLREVARAIVANVRDGRDIVTRYGGEEFAVLISGLSHEGTEALGERIRAAIEALDLPHPRARHAKVTVSVGVAAGVPGSAEALDQLIHEADAALYRSKHLGRNRVTRAGAEESGAGNLATPDNTKSAA